MTAESSLEEMLPIVNQAVDRVLRRRRKGKDFADDFRGWVMLKMLERDGARLKRFRGESRLLTYLRVVVDRLYCDYLISQNGKWRPSKRARERGANSAHLEKLVYHNGYTLDEAVSVVQSRGSNLLESQLRDDFFEIPTRRTRSFVRLDSLAELQADTRSSAYAILRQKEIDDASKSIRDALVDALAELPHRDRHILELRFQNGLRISAISRRLGLRPSSVYGRFHRTLRILRKKLEARGVLRSIVGELTEGSFVPREIEGAFAWATALCDSNVRQPDMVLASLAESFPRASESLSLSV